MSQSFYNGARAKVLAGMARVQRPRGQQCPNDHASHQAFNLHAIPGHRGGVSRIPGIEFAGEVAEGRAALQTARTSAT